jgi:FkbM family methyltransferase
MKLYLLLKFFLHKITQSLLALFNLRLTNKKVYEANIKKVEKIHILDFLSVNDNGNIEKIIKNLPSSKSQFSQDLFVLDHLNFKENGFFVEFGACDGIKLSNSWLLEKKFNWQGILVEPAKFFEEKIKANRSCSIELKCVAKKSGDKIIFHETSDKELSTASNFISSDRHHLARKLSKNYEVLTISLNDLLDKHSCPSKFDYLSIDTEGSEFEIIEEFNFEKHTPKIITIEHNYINEKRNKIYNLLIKKSYKRVFKEISNCDDWYIKI